jgi:prepilin-type N-terminal cleavage/methylation domain-containing protein
VILRSDRFQRCGAQWGSEPPRPGTSRGPGFSLVEILVAVSLLAVIMLGLLAMFYQTQRAFKLGTTQVDVIETGRATMQVLTDELKQMVPAAEENSPALYTYTRYNSLIQDRPAPDVPQVNVLRDIFFMTRQNDQWVARGYFVEALTQPGGAGVLHHFSTNIPVSISNAFRMALRDFRAADPTTAPRLADRVIHLNLTAYDRTGTNVWGNGQDADGKLGQLDFRALDGTNWFPAYVEVELAVVEPRVYERFKARYGGNVANTQMALQYLTGRVDQVHLFRQRIPIRTVQ